MSDEIIKNVFIDIYKSRIIELRGQEEGFQDHQGDEELASEVIQEQSWNSGVFYRHNIR